MRAAHGRRRRRIARIVAGVLACMACVAAIAWALWADGRFLPGWTQWGEASLAADLDGDGAAEEIELSGRRVRVAGVSGSAETPRGWLVSDAFARDVDGDGDAELVLLAWKRGSYGDHHPFWVRGNDPGFSQHIFMLSFSGGELHHVWLSSALGSPVAGASFDDAGRLALASPDGATSLWQWRSWGFALTDEVEEAGAPNTLTMLAVGDNIAHIGVYEGAWVPERRVFDFAPIYAEVADWVSGYDVAVVNQETILVHDPGMRSDFPEFATPESMGDALAGAGFDVVLAATNHACDKGERGVAETLAYWRENHQEVLLLGLHETVGDAAEIDYLTRNGITLALFDYTYGLNGHALPAGREYQVDILDDLDKLLSDLQTAEARADASVVFLHIGDEYATEPSAYQREVVEAVADAGADVVICTHPHVVQPCERIETAQGAGAVVYWSLGNFMSNQDRPETLLGGAAELVFERGDDGEVRVASYDLEYTVSHLDEDGTRVYRLEDYADELAASNMLRRQ